ncbi:MAG: endonuclease III [Oscillospiraceae bacterium]|jgi:endonuclease-3|nr:endonuclease III [Oscillospiraceae bacterium]
MSGTDTDVSGIIRGLETVYPEAACSLEYDKDYELLFSVRLAAQCTDERVNRVTPALFARFPTLEAFAGADAAEVEGYIRSCGFFRGKARDIVECSKMLLSEFGGRVPGTMEELLRLPGVGRKTANLILGDIFMAPSAVVVDTHCIRLSNRLGLVDTRQPEKIETRLRAILPPEKSNAFCHMLVLHGRAVCTARAPRCGECVISELCAFAAGADGAVNF